MAGHHWRLPAGPPAPDRASLASIRLLWCVLRCGLQAAHLLAGPVIAQPGLYNWAAAIQSPQARVIAAFKADARPWCAARRCPHSNSAGCHRRGAALPMAHNNAALLPDVGAGASAHAGGDGLRPGQCHTGRPSGQPPGAGLMLSLIAAVGPPGCPTTCCLAVVGPAAWGPEGSGGGRPPDATIRAAVERPGRLGHPARQRSSVVVAVLSTPARCSTTPT